MRSEHRVVIGVIGDDIHVVGIFQQVGKFVAGKLLIVHDHRG